MFATSSTSASTEREAARLGLAGKPDPATFIEATRRLCLIPAEVAMFEDAIAGVQAGRAGRFGVVVGVARTPSRMPSLEAAGAHVVVLSASDLMFGPIRDDPSGWGAGAHQPC